MILEEILCDVSFLHLFKNLFINQDYIHCGLPINSLTKKKGCVTFLKNINSFKWSLFKGAELKFLKHDTMLIIFKKKNEK